MHLSVSVSHTIPVFFLPSLLSHSPPLLSVIWETCRAVTGLWQIRSKWPVIIFDQWPIRPDRDTDRQADACVDLNLQANVPPWQNKQITQTTHCITHQLQVLIRLLWQMFITGLRSCSGDVRVCGLLLLGIKMLHSASLQCFPLYSWDLLLLYRCFQAFC